MITKGFAFASALGLAGVFFGQMIGGQVGNGVSAVCAPVFVIGLLASLDFLINFGGE